jgi:hypothetical protein
MIAVGFVRGKVEKSYNNCNYDTDNNNCYTAQKAWMNE